ncbi:MAG: sugar phosphate isomerase/epimerase [Hamadaea sp.]|nr:sugar phosphate isomerase/epimerase [Hamadaea sp.]
MTLAMDRVCGIGDEAATDLPEQVSIFTALGLRGLELRSVAGRLSHELDDDAVRRLAATIEDARLTVPVVDTPIGGWATTLATPLSDEVDLLRAYAAVARRVGCSRLRIMSYPSDGRPEPEWGRESIRRVGVLVREAVSLGVTLLHENCHGWASRDAESTLALLRAVEDERLRLIFDAGNGMAYGYEGFEFLQAVLPWVEHVHIKDAVLVNEQPVWVTPGQGTARLTEMLKTLAAAGYDGWLSLEPHVALIPHTGVEAADDVRGRTFAACVRGLRTLIDGLGS